MKLKDFSEANRIAWNAVSPYHRQAMMDQWTKGFLDRGYYSFSQRFKELLGDLRNKSIAQLSCNNGREVVSCMNLGAVSGYGFDISDEAILSAMEFKRISGHEDLHFIRTDVYDIDPSQYPAFDLIFFTIGALPWLKDLPAVFSICRQMLKPGGRLLIYEMHPLIYTLAQSSDKEYDANHPSEPKFDYFNDKILRYEDSLDYFGNQEYDAPPHYEFQHTIGAIINSLITAGLTIQSFFEYPDEIANSLGAWTEDSLIPLSYSLSAVK